MSLSVERTGRVNADSTPEIDRRGALLLVGGVMAVFVVLLLRTAWVSDAAYVTLRTADNFVHGYGLRWNVAERVQGYAHPAWLFLVAATYSVTGEPYFTTLALDLGLTVVALVLLARAARSPLAAAFAVVTLMFSKAFIDFSTSGLENPLTHALLAAFFLVCWQGRKGTGRLAWLALVASFAMLARLDNALIVLPVLVSSAIRLRTRRAWVILGAGLLPLAAWEVFVAAYYGFPLPNAAYARLNAGVAGADMVRHGAIYLLDSLKQDPLTLSMALGGIVVAGAVRFREEWPAVAGVLLYLVYVVWIGGDVMSGRLLTVPLFCGVLLLTRVADPGRLGRAQVVPFLLVILAGLFSPGNPMPIYPVGTREPTVSPTGSVDERLFEDRASGLLQARLGLTLPNTDYPAEALDLLRQRKTTVATDVVGVFGFFAGPRMHVVDLRGDEDPLLARLPAGSQWLTGAVGRTLPDGYLEALDSGGLGLRDPRVAACYQEIVLITRAPIWRRARLAAITRAALGRIPAACH
jgi:arabinofuranosyltransferase